MHNLQGFTATDQALLQECKQHNWFDGATCVAVWLVGHTALVANVGDAKCVLARRPENCSSTSQQASKVRVADARGSSGSCGGEEEKQEAQQHGARRQASTA